MSNRVPEKGSALFPCSMGGYRFDTPLEVVETCVLEEVQEKLAYLEGQVAQGRYVAGFLSYEAAPAFDAALSCHASVGVPLLCFGVYATREVLEALPSTGGDVPEVDWRAEVSQGAYEQAFAQIQEYIAAGNTYQVNYTFPMAGHFRGDAWAWFCQGVAAQGMRE